MYFPFSVPKSGRKRFAHSRRRFIQRFLSRESPHNTEQSGRGCIAPQPYHTTVQTGVPFGTGRCNPISTETRTGQGYCSIRPVRVFLLRLRPCTGSLSGHCLLPILNHFHVAAPFSPKDFRFYRFSRESERGGQFREGILLRGGLAASVSRGMCKIANCRQEAPAQNEYNSAKIGVINKKIIST